jgi:hypothetical protein
MDNLVVDIHWGIDDLDRSNIRKWEVDDIGELIFDREFTISPPENQQALLDLCAELRTRSDIIKENGL